MMQLRILHVYCDENLVPMGAHNDLSMYLCKHVPLHVSEHANVYACACVYRCFI